MRSIVFALGDCLEQHQFVAKPFGKETLLDLEAYLPLAEFRDLRRNIRCPRRPSATTRSPARNALRSGRDAIHAH